MDRRAFITLLGSGILAAPIATEAEQAGKVYRIGLIGASWQQQNFRVLEDALREFGWIEAQNVAFERRLTPEYEQLLKMAAELVRLRVDVVVAGNAPAVQAAKNATASIPIVMAATGDPVAARFVESLSRPGGNVTGLTVMHTELSGKRLELLVDAVQPAKRIAVITNPANPSTLAMFGETEARARTLGVRLTRFDVTHPSRLEAAFAAIANDHAAALVVLGDPMLASQSRRVVELALKHHLPGIYEWRYIAEAGGLMSYGPALTDLFRRSATYVDKILKGAKPGDLPVERPTKFELVINLKTAKALGLTIPQSLLLRADEVIQ